MGNLLLKLLPLLFFGVFKSYEPEKYHDISLYFSGSDLCVLKLKIFLKLMNI